MKAKNVSPTKREEVLVLRKASTATARGTWWGSVRHSAPKMVQLPLSVALALHTARHILTCFRDIEEVRQAAWTYSPETPTLSPWTLYYLVTAVTTLVSQLIFMKSHDVEVRDTDAEEEPDEALVWEWCVPCGMLRPPDASHCSYCHKCIRGRYFHTLSEFKCVQKSNLKSYLFWVWADLLSSQCTLSVTDLWGSFSFLMSCGAVISSLVYLFWRVVATARKAHYLDETFMICGSSKSCADKMQPEISYSMHNGRMHAQICPTGEGGGTCAASTRSVSRCPRPGCNTVSNHFWVHEDEGGIVECNICQATFTLPEEEVREAERAPHDEEWVVTEGGQKPALVFVLATSAAGRCRAIIDAWVRETQPLMDVEVVTPAEGHTRRHGHDRLTNERYAEDVTGHMTLDTILLLASQDLSCRGGRMVFVRGCRSPLARTTLLELGRVARSVPLEYVSLASGKHASLPQDLHPALLRHIERGGGTFTRLFTVDRLAKFLRRRELVPRGVLCSVQVVASPGLHVAHVSGAGVSPFVRGEDARFKAATVSQSTPVRLEVEVDAERVRAARRLTDPHDSRVFLQLQLAYTSLDGRGLRRIYNKAFQPTTVQEARLALSPLP